MNTVPVLDAGSRASFRTEFYERERPVVIRGLAGRPGSVSGMARELWGRVAREGAAEALLWHDVRPEAIDGFFDAPDVVRAVLGEGRVRLRERHVRIWLSAGGHRTPWHYDGNSLHVFNLQMKGVKRWRIVSPRTPLMCLPFSPMGMFREVSIEGREAFEFDLNEGDLLFLPRYWFHWVESRGDLNINLNWVVTPGTAPPDSPGARREAELAWIKRRLIPRLPEPVRDYFDGYAGGAGAEAGDLGRRVSGWQALSRSVRESLKLPLLLLQLPGHLAGVRRMRRDRQRLLDLLGPERVA